MAFVTNPYTGIFNDQLEPEDVEMSPEPEEASESTNPVPRISSPPPRRNPPSVIPATIFAPVYRSTYLAEKVNNHLFKHLAHVNCSYLSTPGVAPNLIQLKQHAQSLAILIKSLTLSTKPIVIDSVNTAARSDSIIFPPYSDGESWDWLTDLNTPYKGPANAALYYHHSLPLTSLLNVLETAPVASVYHEGVQVSVRDRCALYNAEHHLNNTPNGSALPYASHASLISHANRILELLDHEYSAKGGLLSILPPAHEKQDRKKAESTLLGQHILYTQRLVSRLHELEREHANALDVLTGEAKVPLQTLSRLGPDGRKGRELAYPQDKFVLVNAGENVWDYLDREFNTKERVDEVVRKDYLRQGVIGEKLWESRGGQEFDRGITAIDVTTRYYRLRYDPLKTIFVIPAWQSHPGAQATVELEKKPTVVSVVRPVWPERQSLWEQKNRGNLEELRTLRRENAHQKDEIGMQSDSNVVLEAELEKRTQRVRELDRKVNVLESTIAGKLDSPVVKDFYEKYQSIKILEEQATQRFAEAERKYQEIQEAEKSAQIRMKALEEELERRQRNLAERQKNWEKEERSRMDQLKRQEMGLASGGARTVSGFGGAGHQGLRNAFLGTESLNVSRAASPIGSAIAGEFEESRVTGGLGGSNFKGQGRTLGQVTISDATDSED